MSCSTSLAGSRLEGPPEFACLSSFSGIRELSLSVALGTYTNNVGYSTVLFGTYPNNVGGGGRRFREVPEHAAPRRLDLVDEDRRRSSRSSSQMSIVATRKMSGTTTRHSPPRWRPHLRLAGSCSANRHPPRERMLNPNPRLYLGAACSYSGCDPIKVASTPIT
jgi:hypothetical protein